MAEKRMFSKTIIDSDAFLDMPLSTQSLYFHLSMRADDDGFLNNVKKIQRMIGASGDDLKILFAKKFLLAFPDGVCVVKHWRMHNYIAKDRYKPTNYESHKMALIVNENGSYSQKSKENQHVIQDDGSLYTDCIQDDDVSMTQIRLDKIRLDKIRLDKSSSAAKPRFEPAKDEKAEKPKSKRVSEMHRTLWASDVSEQTWADWCELRNKKKAVINQTVIDGARAEAEKLGISLEDLLKIWVLHGWQGFKAEWVLNERRKSEQQQQFKSAAERRDEHADKLIQEILARDAQKDIKDITPNSKKIKPLFLGEKHGKI